MTDTGEKDTIELPIGLGVGYWIKSLALIFSFYFISTYKVFTFALVSLFNELGKIFASGHKGE